MTPPESDWQPLAERIRPARVEEVVGQDHLLGPDQPLTRALTRGRLYSMVLWGPPGTGKTTLARLMAQRIDARFIGLSAVLAGVKEVRQAVDQARAAAAEGQRTVLFLDEVHRFNKAQQDAFLPHIEDGTIVFVGATTENPSFELNNALLSRLRVHVLKPLNAAAMRRLIDRALADPERGLGHLNLNFAEADRDTLAAAADGDARRALNWLELAAELAEPDEAGRTVTEAVLAEVMGGSLRRFDKGGDAFYDQISALHKSVRGSAPDAALYWYARMLDGGCDPHYVARRVVRMASEDIGNADPRGLQLSLNAWEALERLGSPEGELAVAQAIVYLAVAPKSNAVDRAYKAARADAAKRGSLEVPMHLRNAPTKLMKAVGAGRGYRYAHDEPDGYAAGERYFPEDMPEQDYYRPVPRGLELRIRERLETLRAKDREARRKSGRAG